MEQPSHLSELTSPVKLSTIVGTAVSNNATCFKNTTQLESLQSWLRQQVELYK